MRLPSDVVVGLFILCLCGLLWYLTTRFDSDLLGLVGGMPATAMPRLVIYIISALCLLVIVNGWRSNGPAVGSFPAWQMWATAGLLGLVAISFRFLGLPLAFFAVCLLLPLLWARAIIGLFSSLRCWCQRSSTSFSGSYWDYDFL